MPLTRMNEFKREDYSYESPDGDQYEITIVQTSDRKYVEIKREDGEEEAVQWDVEMLLDIADAIRSATQKPVKRKAHQLQKPAVIDHRVQESETPSDMIQASVEESMDNMDPAISPVQSFSNTNHDAVEEMLKRKDGPPVALPDASKKIRRTS